MFFFFLSALQTRATVSLMKHTARRENKEERRESDGSSLSREHWQASIHGTHDHWYWFVSPLQISEMYFYPKGRHTVESINGGEAGAWTMANQGNKEEQWGGWWKHGRNYEDISARKRIALSIHPILREVQWLKWSWTHVQPSRVAIKDRSNHSAVCSTPTSAPHLPL